MPSHTAWTNYFVDTLGSQAIEDLIWWLVASGPIAVQKARIQSVTLGLRYRNSMFPAHFGNRALALDQNSL
jgi:hypothetical protein